MDGGERSLLDRDELWLDEAARTPAPSRPPPEGITHAVPLPASVRDRTATLLRRPGALPAAMGLLATLAVVVHLFVPTTIGMADNGDAGRLACQLGVQAKADANGQRYFKHLVTTYNETTWKPGTCTLVGVNRYPTSELVLLRAAVWLSDRLGFQATLDLRVLGILCALLFGAAVAALTAVLPGRRRTRAVVAGAVVIIVADAAFAPYFVSMYTEPVGILAVVFLAATWLWVPRRPALRWLPIVPITVCSIALVTTNASTALLALPLAVALVLRRLGGDRRRRATTIAQRAVAATGACAIVAIAAAFASGQPSSTTEPDSYNAVFYSLLGHSAKPAADLAALGLDPALARNAGTTFWSATGGSKDPGYYEFTRAFSYSRLVSFYLSHPLRLLDLHLRMSTAAADLRPRDIGNYRAAAGKPPGARECRICLVSAVLPGVAGWAWLTLPMLWAAAAVIGAQLACRSRGDDVRQWRALGELLVLLGAGAACVYAAGLIGQGDYDAVKHQVISNLMSGLAVPLLVLGAVRWWRVRASAKRATSTTTP